MKRYAPVALSGVFSFLFKRYKIVGLELELEQILKRPASDYAQSGLPFFDHNILAVALF